MAFATYHETTGSPINTPSTSHTVSWPATVNSGDFLLLFGQTNANNVVTTPTGWTLLHTSANGNPGTFVVFGKIATGSESGTFTVTVSSSQAGAWQIRRYSSTRGGLVAGTDYDISSGSGWSNTSTPDPDSVTATWGAEDNTYVAIGGGRGDNDTASSAPTNYINLVSTASTNGGGGGAEVYSADRQLAASSDNPSTFTLTGTERVYAATVVIRPAGASSGSAAISATATVSATGTRHRYASAALTASATVAASGRKLGAAALSASSSVSATGRKLGAAALSASSSVSALGYNHDLNVTETPSGGAAMAGAVSVTFTDDTTPVDSDIELLWDLDGDGDFDQAVEDITAYIQDLEVSYGRDFPSQLTGRSTRGRLKGRLKNLDERFSYFNADSPLNADPFSLASGRKIRVQIAGATAPDPTLIARDRFGGSGTIGDDEEGNTWLTGSATWTQADGAITTPTAVARATMDLGALTTWYSQATFRWIDADNSCGIYYRRTDSSNTGYVYLDGTTLGHQTILAGVGTVHSTTTIETVRGHVTIGVEVNADDDVTVYLEGVAMFTDAGDGSVANVGSGTEHGIVCSHNNHRHPAPEDWGVWDRLWLDSEGVLFTGDVTAILPTSHLGGAHTADIEAEGWLTRLAGPEITPPTSIGVTGDSPGGVTAGVMIGAAMVAAGQLHPPPPGGLDAGALTFGAVGTDDAKALTVARKMEATELGFLHETPHGPVTFADSTARASASAVASFSDAKADQHRYTEIELLNWRRELFNRVSAEVSPHVPFRVTSVAGASDQAAGVTMTVTITLPTSLQASAGNLLLICIVAPCQLDGEPFITPAGWTALNDPGDALGRQHWYAKKLTSTDLGTSETFYSASAAGGGTWIQQWWVISDWYGSIEDGVDITEPTGAGDATVADAQAGTHELPAILPRWGRQATLFLTTRSGAYTSTSGSVSFTDPDDLPDGFLEGTSTFQAGTVATDDVALQSAIKHDVASVLAPSGFGGTFTGFDVLECFTIAVRGYAGDPPESDGGEIVTVEDLDSQARHNVIGSYPVAGSFFASSTDADAFCDDVLATYADERPLYRLGFWAWTQSLRYQAYTLRLGDVVRVVADGRAGMGTNDLFYVERITHRWGKDKARWWCELELSPA